MTRDEVRSLLQGIEDGRDVTLTFAASREIFRLAMSALSADTHLTVTCDFCGHVLGEPGALIFSPPENNVCVKQHVCRACWDAGDAVVINKTLRSHAIDADTKPGARG